MASIEFFDRQFQAQIKAEDFELNPFEIMSLEYLEGRVLDMGAGLGNLALEAARRGHQVVAVEGSGAAIARIRRDAAAEGLSVIAQQGNALEWQPGDDVSVRAQGQFDSVVSIGLLAFFRKEGAYRLLAKLAQHVKPGGLVILNFLCAGTDYMAMFEGDEYYLFDDHEVESLLPRWDCRLMRKDTFPAADGTKKVFVSLVLRKPRVG